MKDIERMLRENLQREAPDHREDILAADPQPDKGELFRIPRRWIAAGCGIAAALLLCVGIGLPVLKKELNVSAPDSMQPENECMSILTDSTQHGTGGDGRGEYEVISWDTAVPLPDGEIFYSYAFTGDESLGESVLALINRLFDTEFSEDIDLSEYECRLGDDPSELFLWGNLDAGMFYYQHIIDYTSEELLAADPAVIGPQTEKAAADIVEKIAQLVGPVRLEKKWREDFEGVDEVWYYYRYAPENPITIDGYATSADLTICFDTLGEVMTLRCDMSACEKYVHHSVTFGENILEVFKNTLGDVGIPETEVCITGCRIEYVQTIGLEDYATASPVLMLTYTINGEGEYELPILAEEV
ncbi:MAG: hypothetical protein IKT60_01630 [Clostridia bacterium]|nr:hypothetical protein [Clostridia bacterium]